MQLQPKIWPSWKTMRLLTWHCRFLSRWFNCLPGPFVLTVLIELQLFKWLACGSSILHHWCDKTSLGMIWRKVKRISPFVSSSMFCSSQPESEYISVGIYFSNCRDIENIKNGIGEQASHFLNTVLGSIVCIVVSFIYGWKLTLVVISYLPIVCLMNFFITKVRQLLCCCSRLHKFPFHFPLPIKFN